MRTPVNSKQVVGSKDADTKPAFFRRGILTKLLCLLALLIIVPMQVQADPVLVVDGKVEGFDEGYTIGYNLSFDVEGVEESVSGGFLYVHENVDYIWVGLIAPLTIDDNTYGDDDHKASDWGG